MEYTLHSPRGTAVTLSDRGAAIRRVQMADRLGRFSNIALCPCASTENPAQTAYAGATLGPSAGRVPNGELTLSGVRVNLSRNEGGHHLHGGYQNLSAEVWRCEQAGENAFTFVCKAEAGRDGYPGNRVFTAEYTLTPDDRLRLRLRCETDAPTWVSLSHHVYWNLSGDFTATVGNHRLSIAATRACWNDGEHIPCACREVAGTALDFRAATPLARTLALRDAQLRNARGLNNLYLLDGHAQAAVLSHPGSGRTLSVRTDLPALVVYSGGYLDQRLMLEGGVPASPGCAIALEPQLMPITPFWREASAVTTPEHPFDHWIEYALSVDAPTEV